MKKYSDWLKIDLHLHTDFSKKTKENDYQGDFSVEVLHQKLIENDVEIFSLTDHNIINIPAYEEYYSNHNSSNDPLLLVGVELDIEVPQEEGGVRVYHSLLIFNDHTIERAEKLSKTLEDEYSDKGIRDKERKLTIDEIVRLFPDDDFFFIPHAGNTKSIIDGHRGNIEDAQKMVLLMQSAFEKVPEKARQTYNEGFNKVLHDAFQDKDDIPYLQFSDNHNINQYPKTHKGGEDANIHEFYYIKGSKNYETLRLAFIDPKSRIKSTSDYKSINHLNNTIDKLKIEDEGTIENNEIYFSPHLNVIIGGRSSGKSLLMNLLGKNIDKVNIDDKYNKINNDKVTIKAKYDDDYKEQTSITDDLIYLNQGDIVHYFEENKLEALAEKSEKKEEYERRKSLFQEHKTYTQDTVQSVIDAYDEAHSLGKEKKYILHKSTIDKMFSEEYVFSIDKAKIIDFNKLELISESKDLLDTLAENTTELKKKNILDFIDSEIKIIEDFESLLSTKIALISHKEMLNQKKSAFIQKITTKIKEVNSTLTSNAQEKSLAKQSLEDFKEDIKSKFSIMNKLKNECNSLEDFDYSKKERIELSEGVALVLNVEGSSSIKSLILEGINNTDNNKSLYINLANLLSNNSVTIKHLTGNDPDKLKQKINRQLEDIYKFMDKPKDYLEYEDGSTSKDNSPGYNSEKYLKLILNSPNTKLIFIDQPEDNLGNRFIADTLVDIIRDIKFKKQIFLVTHNPAVAVYGDAECIIIAENNENTISYKQIVLEDKESQKEICRILDGGEYIFDNRSRKYNIQRILKEGEA